MNLSCLSNNFRFFRLKSIGFLYLKSLKKKLNIRLKLTCTDYRFVENWLQTVAKNKTLLYITRANTVGVL